jgi:tRNA (cytidine/uridine-2'-O-)-methyltransferase
VKLRLQPPLPGLRIVLVQPEIPQNTGAIARLCAATGASLHLVGRLGFDTDEHAVRRAGLDYWHLVDVHRHADLDECLAAPGSPAPILLTANADRPYWEAPFEPGAALVFGQESVGLSRAILEAHPGRAFAIPTAAGGVRSLNLANAAAIVVYEALRRLGALERTTVEE